MDSFFLAEMFKYLYLLFADKEDMIFDIEDYIFTTEAHLLPLWLSTTNQTIAKKNTVSNRLISFSSALKQFLFLWEEMEEKSEKNHSLKKYISCNTSFNMNNFIILTVPVTSVWIMFLWLGSAQLNLEKNAVENQQYLKRKSLPISVWIWKEHTVMFLSLSFFFSLKHL